LVTSDTNIDVIDCGNIGASGSTGLNFIFPTIPCLVPNACIERACQGNAMYVASASGIPATGAMTWDTYTYVWYLWDATTSTWGVSGVVTGNSYYSPPTAGDYAVKVADLANDCVILPFGSCSYNVAEIVSCKDCP